MVRWITRLASHVSLPTLALGDFGSLLNHNPLEKLENLEVIAALELLVFIGCALVVLRNAVRVRNCLRSRMSYIGVLQLAFYCSDLILLGWRNER